MLEENKDKLIPAADATAALDLRRDYHYGRGLPAEGEDTHLRDYWRVVRRRLWVPISVVFVTVTLTTIYMLRVPSIYQGETTIQIDQPDSSVFNLKELRINVGDDGQDINTQLRNLRSPTIAYRVIKALDLEHNGKFLGAEPSPDQPQTLRVTRGESDLRIDRAEMERLEWLTNLLLDGMEVERLRETRLVQIRSRHTDKELARTISDTWADQFIENNRLTRQKGNLEASSFLAERIGDVKIDLKRAENALVDYRRTSQVLDSSEKENTVLARLADLNRLLLQAENERKSAQTAYEVSRRVTDPSALPEIQRDGIVQELNKKVNELKQRRALLMVEYTSEWHEVKQIDQQLAHLEGERQAAYQRILAALENQYRSALNKEEMVRRDFNAQKGETLQQNVGAIQAKMLQQEVDTNRSLLDKLLQSQKEIAVASASIKSNIFITEYSQLPHIPVGPKRAQNIILSFFLALIGGVGLVLFLDYINNKIESVEDIDRYLRLPALGVIPIFPAGKARKRLAGVSASREIASLQRQRARRLSHPDGGGINLIHCRELPPTAHRLAALFGRPRAAHAACDQQPAGRRQDHHQRQYGDFARADRVGRADCGCRLAPPAGAQDLRPQEYPRPVQLPGGRLRPGLPGPSRVAEPLRPPRRTPAA